MRWRHKREGPMSGRKSGRCLVLRLLRVKPADDEVGPPFNSNLLEVECAPPGGALATPFQIKYRPPSIFFRDGLENLRRRRGCSLRAPEKFVICYAIVPNPFVPLSECA